MSIEEFVKQLQERHKEDIGTIGKLLEILEDLQQEDRQVYDYCIAGNP